MGTLYVTEDGSEIPIDPEMFVLLYMPLENYDQVKRYLEETKLDSKFEIIPGKVSIRDKNDDEAEWNEGITSLILKMKSDRVLFEYRLSGRVDKLLDDISEYMYGSEEEES